MRLAKVGEHTAVIVDIAADGRLLEYDPLKPETKWDGKADWPGSDQLRIAIGPYSLSAERVDAKIGLFRGMEDGPYGQHSFDVFVVSKDVGRLVHPQASCWIAFNSGTFTPTIVDPWHVEHLPSRRVGVAVGWFPTGGVKTPSDPAEFHGIYGGRHLAFRVTTYPNPDSSDRELRIDIDTHERPGKYSWYDWDALVADFDACCYRSPKRLLYPVEFRHTSPGARPPNPDS